MESAFPEGNTERETERRGQEPCEKMTVGEW